MSIREAIGRAPLAPVALLATAGILADRAGGVPGPVWPALLAAGLLGWLAARRTGPVAATGLAVAIAATAGWHHHLARFVFPPDDVGFFATDEPRLVRLRGRLAEEPTYDPPAANNPLRGLPEAARTRCLLAADELLGDAGAQPVSGLVALTLVGPRPALRAGDAVEVTGWFARPRGADNPGERDPAAALLDRRVRAVLHVRHVGPGSVSVASDPRWSWTGMWSAVRAWSRQQFDATLPPREAGIAAALLLGDGAALSRADWEKYVRTGVVHVLAVSGQHLAILAGAAWLVLRVLGVPRRPGAAAVALLLCGYAGLAGGRPAVLRAAVMAVAACVALLLRRRAHPANILALAWLAALAVNPADVVDPGALFSFLCVAVLIWGIGPALDRRGRDPLEEVIEESRPAWQRVALAAGRAVAAAYLVTLVLGLVVMPLTAFRYHLVSPAGLVIGPPAILLASVALLAGFAQLAVALVAASATGPLAAVTGRALSGLDAVVTTADGWPWGHAFTGDVPLWWLAGFYLLVVAGLGAALTRRRLALALSGWLAVGAAATAWPPARDGLRVTFLAVGHGGATVLELPDGRTVLVDCGSAAGPEVTRRVVAPFLWSRRVRRIDELILTHADLDHFNGVPALLERFPVGRVTANPSFAAKDTPGVAELMRAVEAARVPTRVVRAGDRFSAGAVEFEGLHPPAAGPPGPENARSLVLRVRHAGHTILLTGDIDGEGRAMLLRGRPPAADVWQAPHHGGRLANPPELAVWARPAAVVAHNAPGEAAAAAAVYREAGATFVGTWPAGAVTIESSSRGLHLHAYHAPRAILIRP
jgi:competence protein ComEC